MTDTPPSDLDTLIPKSRSVAISEGITVLIEPIRVRELPAFAATLAPLLAALKGGNSDLLGLLAEHPNALIEATAIGSRLPRVRLDALGVDELIELAAAVVAVNADFFSLRVLPALTQAMRDFGQAPSPAAGSPSTYAAVPPDSAPSRT